MERSGIGVGEYDPVAPATSISCSCSTAVYLGSRMNFGTESLAVLVELGPRLRGNLR